MNDNDIYITAARRTAMGSFQGAFATKPATELGSVAIAAVIADSGIDPARIDDLYFGNVVSADLGQAPARQAALGGGVPESVPCTTINKVCGAGMKAAMIARDQIRAGSGDIVLAGGMESMSRTPYYADGARQGARLGHGVLKDALFRDGLEDAETGGLMGQFGQSIADQYGYSREAMDDFAIESLTRAQAAIANGWFADEVVPVKVKTRREVIVVDEDEQPGKGSIKKIPELRPAFSKDGTITAANASSMSDGAAAMLLASATAVAEHGMTPSARLVGQASFARAPAEFCLSPVGAIQKLLDDVGWKLDDVDLFEINEAFAVVSLLAIDQLKLPREKVNVHGGACALGHPLGASGARLMVTLVHALRRTGGHRGIASLCIGGGEATAVAVELV